VSHASATAGRLPRREPLFWLLGGAGLLAALCILAPLAVGVAGTRITSYDVPGTVINACLAAVLESPPYVGLSWRLPGNPKIEASAWVRTYPGMLCWKLPRFRILPDEGALRFPAAEAVAVGWRGH
jgi:hypothetical protein